MVDVDDETPDDGGTAGSAGDDLNSTGAAQSQKPDTWKQATCRVKEEQREDPPAIAAADADKWLEGQLAELVGPPLLVG